VPDGVEEALLQPPFHPGGQRADHPAGDGDGAARNEPGEPTVRFAHGIRVSSARMFRLACLLAFPARADEADDLLARVDAAQHQAGDAHLVLDVATVDSSGPASRTLEIWQKGEARRLVRFTAPARLAGVALLATEEATWLYLPAYGKPRRVVGASRGDAFLGTDFALEDLARITWSDDYDPELMSAGHLRLAARAGADASSATVDLVVRAEDALPVTVEHMDAAGKVVRRIRFDDFRAVGAHTIAHTIVVEDVRRGRTTTARITDVTFDGGVSDDLFTLSRLQP
jgi:outer membrane lipoprotein-sorting protein